MVISKLGKKLEDLYGWTTDIFRVNPLICLQIGSCDKNSLLKARDHS